MKKIYNRFYSDYLLPSRMGEYEEIHRIALDNGYCFETTLDFYRKTVIENKSLTKVFIHRHDIDTDVKTAKRFFEVEQKLGIKSSYYFRLSTIDVGLMNEIAAAGHEVGYHYEELAQYCKDFKIKTWEKAKLKLPEIQNRFIENFKTLESKLNFKIKSIASHGDFVNRSIGHPNHELITKNLMDSLGIDLECYDEKLVQNYNVVLSDKPYPKFYRDISPREAIANKTNVIYLLSHTRHWHVARWENTVDNVNRFWEGIKYKF